MVYIYTSKKKAGNLNNNRLVLHKSRMAHKLVFQDGQNFCVACGGNDGSRPCPHSIEPAMLEIEKSKADIEARKADIEARKADTEALKVDLFKWLILCGNYYILYFGVSYKEKLSHIQNITLRRLYFYPDIFISDICGIRSHPNGNSEIFIRLEV